MGFIAMIDAGIFKNVVDNIPVSILKYIPKNESLDKIYVFNGSNSSSQDSLVQNMSSEMTLLEVAGVLMGHTNVAYQVILFSEDREFRKLFYSMNKRLIWVRFNKDQENESIFNEVVKDQDVKEKDVEEEKVVEEKLKKGVEKKKVEEGEKIKSEQTKAKNEQISNEKINSEKINSEKIEKEIEIKIEKNKTRDEKPLIRDEKPLMVVNMNAGHMINLQTPKKTNRFARSFLELIFKDFIQKLGKYETAIKDAMLSKEEFFNCLEKSRLISEINEFIEFSDISNTKTLKMFERIANIFKSKKFASFHFITEKISYTYVNQILGFNKIDEFIKYLCECQILDQYKSHYLPGIGMKRKLKENEEKITREEENKDVKLEENKDIEEKRENLIGKYSTRRRKLNDKDLRKVIQTLTIHSFDNTGNVHRSVLENLLLDFEPEIKYLGFNNIHSVIDYLLNSKLILENSKGILSLNSFEIHSSTLDFLNSDKKPKEILKELEKFQIDKNRLSNLSSSFSSKSFKRNDLLVHSATYFLLKNPLSKESFLNYLNLKFFNHISNNKEKVFDRLVELDLILFDSSSNQVMLNDDSNLLVRLLNLLENDPEGGALEFSKFNFSSHKEFLKFTREISQKIESLLNE
ncbi:hypothetical protein ROZALSC1DRAFT_30574, partial [Rozella allomycis CSF55]